MTKSTFQSGADVYNADGAVASYVGPAPHFGHVVLPCYEHDDEEPHYGEPEIWPEAFATPPRAKLAEDLAELRQDISAAGRGAGLAGKRSGLWSQMARIVAEVRPRYVYVENSPILTSRGLGTVLGDLAALGFDAEWGVVSAADTGAQHLRERIWIVAHAHGQRHGEAFETVCTGRHAAQPGRESLPDADHDEIQRRCSTVQMGRRRSSEEDGHHGHALGNEWPPEPDVGRVANGVAHRVDRLNGLGNGQVPRVAAAAFHLLSSRI
ncbi:DNA cytosine methyltransferase [Achromobacter ruhlandii]|uniref:DNA cytosine methyltransferase n=1 Tax=Achromobacter ruhlandii TaxID=72557 RepID=UPI001C129EA2|nr:DNA cytosine methyltransferase [Achromobacter ruhlandii]